MDSITYADLMRHSRFPGDLRTVAFAGVIAQALAAQRQPLIRGMDEKSFERLMRTCFPGIALQNGGAARRDTDTIDEFDDLLELLLDHRAEPGQIHEWLSYCVASAAMHEQHLWQDMGLPNRTVLSRLLLENFPALAAQNSGDMKWKKFLYRQLCQRTGLVVCRSPNCAVCSDYEVCFGPEAAVPAAAAAVGHHP